MNENLAVDTLELGISRNIRDYFEGVPKVSMYLEEAEFGVRRIMPFLAELPNGAKVLEVGSGPCIVLAEMAQRFPDLTIQGIEPMCDGFAFFEDFVHRVCAARSRVNVHLGGYEDFPPNGNWDLIFLINVFEHLPDWREFLNFVELSLAPGGRCVVLCPNYGFPYESHFKLPVVLNKRLTGFLFRRKIDRFERENESSGLFHSLNFVRLSQVRKAAQDVGLELTLDPEIILEMINRLETDPAFRERQKVLRFPVGVLHNSGLLTWLLKQRLVQNFLPYMQITLSKRG